MPCNNASILIWLYFCILLFLQCISVAVIISVSLSVAYKDNVSFSHGSNETAYIKLLQLLL